MLQIKKEYVNKDVTVTIRRSLYGMIKIKLSEATQDQLKLIKKAGLPYAEETKPKK